MEWELLDRPGSVPRRFRLTTGDAVQLLRQAIDSAKEANLPWQEQPLLLKPSGELLKLVRLSQLEATKESSD
jgi:hypothetical protein